MFPTQEPKYGVTATGQVFNRTTGKVIPDDEPVMVFRAQDKKAIVALWAYYDACVSPDHRAVVKARILDFERFAKEHPERMKEPDSNLREVSRANFAGIPEGQSESIG